MSSRLLVALGLICSLCYADDSPLAFASYYGSNMVLQKAPKQAKVWGVGTVGNKLTLTMQSQNGLEDSYSTIVKPGYYPTFAKMTGVWSFLLAATPAGGPYTLRVKDTTTMETVTLSNVLFGDVWVCGGQSNMQFSMNMLANATAEIATADNYPNIRLFKTTEVTSEIPLLDLSKIDERWSVSSKAAVAPAAKWSYFSAVCWLYGRYLYNQLKYPIGLVESVWGGTAVEQWSSPDALKTCGIEQSHTSRSGSQQGLKMESIASVNVVQCNATAYCPSQMTCCKMTDGNWGCCPFENAVCCDDHLHCCQEGSVCNQGICHADGKTSVAVRKEPARHKRSTNLKWSVKVEADDVRCDASSSCPSGNTCCKMADGSWACCPAPKAVCCSDHVHCCPHGTTCDVSRGSCLGAHGSVPWQRKMPAIRKDTNDIQCDATTSCPSGNTCCKLVDGSWGCCPQPMAVCCSDHIHCCPQGTTCDVSQGTCLSSRGSVPWLRKMPAIKKDTDVQCDATTSCPSGSTCCKLLDGSWGCCPQPMAVCCSDHVHCCPHGTTCDVSQGTCLSAGGSVPWLHKMPTIKKDTNDIQCDATTSCPSGNTCCKLLDGSWGCCPQPMAVCCSDHVHCCPHGTTCDVSQGTCLSARGSVPLLRKMPAIKKDTDIQCDATTSCPSGNTCCKLLGGSWGCCPQPMAVCCSDHVHCCPHGTTCDVSQGTCLSARGSVPWLRKIPVIKKNTNDIQCDATTGCPSGNTCCKMLDGSWGCCPEPMAVCCSDHLHCCPQGTTCDVSQGTCLSSRGSVPWLRKMPAIKKDTDIQCDATTSCPSGSTCCKLLDGSWGCCPVPMAVCCSDNVHCCPHGTTCDVIEGTCLSAPGSVPWLRKMPAIRKDTNDIQCDATTSCPSGNTCCKLLDGSWGCCPEPMAVCCSDHIHCCPQGTTCDVSQGTCLSARGSVPWLRKIPAIKKDTDIQCDATTSCPSGNTCCKMLDGSWGCCPEPMAVCCSDHVHCCPQGTTCDVSQGTCLSARGRVPWLRKMPAYQNDENRWASDPSLYADNGEFQASSNTVLWNAMIHPLLNMTIYGAIWYQGEANASPPTMDKYNCTFPAMIDDWRRKFHEGSDGQTDTTFPFGFVQLAANRDPKKGGGATSGFTNIRWHQTADVGYVPNARMKNVFMAVAMDLPDYSSPFTSIHPEDKEDVAVRLGLGGMAVAYNKPKVKFQGPFPMSFDVSPLNVTVIYTDPKSRLVVRSKAGFELCCTAQKQMYCAPNDKGWAVSPVAGTSGNTVTLMYPFACEGKQVSGIRYAWAESPCAFKKCAIYDADTELPAPPFIFFEIAK